MNWKTLFFPPIAIYGAVSVWIVVLGSMHIDRNSSWVWAIGLIITTIGLYLAAKFIRPQTLRQGFLICLGWLGVFVVMDIILAVAFAGLEYFSDWKTYLPYALTFLIPIFFWKLRSSTTLILNQIKKYIRAHLIFKMRRIRMNGHVDELTGVGNAATARPDVNPDRNLPVDENQCEQHSAIKSILLHLIPGIPIIAGLFLFSLPFFSKLLGIAVELRVFLGLTLSILITLIPVELGILFYAGKKLNGKLSLKGVISFTEKSSLKSYLLFVPILLVYAIIMFVLISPLFTPSITEALFAWYPQEYNLQNLWSNPGDFSGYQGIFLLLGLFIIINGVLGPFVEELYFKGYLLPRMKGYAGRWAPALNIALFSLYHFFSPWENPIRILAFLPWGYVVWGKRDIRFSILVHILMNTGNGIMLLTQILA